MAENTYIDINKIEKRLLNLIAQFGIKIEKSYHGMSDDNPSMLWSGFAPEKSEYIRDLVAEI